MMMYSRNILGYGLFHSGWGWIIGIGLALIVIATVYLVIHRSKRTTYDANALEILKNKFAQGDITVDEYQKRKSVLSEK